MYFPEYGLYDYKARAYSPTLGRFLQTDPIGYGDGLNWYNYVGSDPVNGTDPSGSCVRKVMLEDGDDSASLSSMFRLASYSEDIRDNGEEQYAANANERCGSPPPETSDTPASNEIVVTAQRPAPPSPSPSNEIVVTASYTNRSSFDLFTQTNGGGGFQLTGGTSIGPIPRDADGYYFVGKVNVTYGSTPATFEMIGGKSLKIITYSANILSGGATGNPGIPIPFGQVTVEFGACASCFLSVTTARTFTGVFSETYANIGFNTSFVRVSPVVNTLPRTDVYLFGR